MPFVSSEYLQHISPEKRDDLLRTHIRFGYHPETGDALLIPDADRFAGSYVCGIQGCLHPDTPILDPIDGTTCTVSERYAKGEAFNVLALDGQNVVIARAEAPLQYTKAPMYELDNGLNSIKVTGHHRIWDGSRYVECEVLYGLQGVFGISLPTIPECELSRVQSRAAQSTNALQPYPDCPLCEYSYPNFYRITRVEDEIYYDFHVPQYENYYACGLFHHNTGKSAFIENLIWADHQAGNAVIVIDPHGDLVVNSIATLPPHRLAHTYLLDMNDETFPFGINVFTSGPFKTSVEQSQVVDRIMHIFDVLWPDVLGQQALPRYMRAAIITLLANPGSTLVDMYRLLLDDAFRASLLRQVTDESVTQFWQTQFNDIQQAERLRRVQPLIGRLESLFMGRSLVRNIVGQRRTTINFRQAIENHEVILIRLPVKTVPQDARLIGTMIVSQIHAAIFSFADIPEKQRPGVSLYIDEFQEFATYDIDELFTQGRKYGVKLTVAHQYRNQLPKYLQDATMTARTKVCFQTTPDDGSELGRVFPVQTSEVRPEDVEPKPIEHLLKYGSPDTNVQTFIDFYVRPMTATKHGSRVDIEGGQITYSLWHGASVSQIFVGDPTPYLNHLLYDVMCSGDPNLPLSFDALAGFANCGRKFYTQIRLISDEKLSADVQFPRHLVAPDGDNSRWLRPPETPGEQLLHLLFHVRMTMNYLSKHPIGDAAAPSAAEVGRMLTQLPRRAAFVRSGETTGVIYTDDTPGRLSGSALQTRGRGILQQSRTKYAHPRADVEAAMRQPNVPPATQSVSVPVPVSRWEEM